MDQNPYESPRDGEPFEEKRESGSIQQLLTEIRDAQVEMLELQREAMLRARKTMRFSYTMFIPLVLIMLLPLLMTFFMRRALPMPRFPVRPAPPAAP
jgi:hypothetical protein